MSHVFERNGLAIDWSENSIPKDIHNKIIKNFSNKKNKKQTYTLSGDGRVEYTPSTLDNRRGGGLHINVSGIDEKCLVSWACELHTKLRTFRSLEMKSHYRSNILFRDRDIVY